MSCVRAAEALGDVVAGELDVHAAGVGAERGVHLEEAADLVHDVVEVPRLVAVGALGGVAVHRVAGPDDAAGPAAASTASTIAGQHVADRAARPCG